MTSSRYSFSFLMSQRPQKKCILLPQTFMWKSNRTFLMLNLLFFSVSIAFRLHQSCRIDTITCLLTCSWIIVCVCVCVACRSGSLCPCRHRTTLCTGARSTYPPASTRPRLDTAFPTTHRPSAAPTASWVRLSTLTRPQTRDSLLRPALVSVHLSNTFTCKHSFILCSQSAELETQAAPAQRSGKRSLRWVSFTL